MSGFAKIDRQCGVLLGTATGDALGAGYEFGPALSAETAVFMKGGGSFHWAPGQWTDDTAMAIAIAEVAARGDDLRAVASHEAIVARWLAWKPTSPDCGIQTGVVLHGILGSASSGLSLVERAHREAERFHRSRNGQSAGNGSLMRTAPIALAYLDDGAEAALVEAATAVSALTHYEADAAEACVLWCLAIRHAVRTGEIDVRRGFEHVPAAKRETWAERLDVAERSVPPDFTKNGWVVEALQAAWCAIATTPEPADDPKRGTFRADRLRLALEAAVRGGGDTDTVAAIAGGLLGAAYGASAVPAAWRRVLHGWPALRAPDLITLADRITRGGVADGRDLSYSQFDGSAHERHPHDDGVWIGGIEGLRSRRESVDAVVSLCQVAAVDRHPTAETIDVRLIDEDGENPHLAFVLHDTANLIADLRSEGKTVLLHCVAAHSRTPAVAALYGMRKRGLSVETAVAEIAAVLPRAQMIRSFRDALQTASDVS